MYQKSENPFLTKGPYMRKVESKWKVLSCGGAEIEKVKYARGPIFNFSSATMRNFLTLTPLFSSMDQCSKKGHSDF